MEASLANEVDLFLTNVAKLARSEGEDYGSLNGSVIRTGFPDTVCKRIAQITEKLAKLIRGQTSERSDPTKLDNVRHGSHGQNHGR